MTTQEMDPDEYYKGKRVKRRREHIRLPRTLRIPQDEDLKELQKELSTPNVASPEDIRNRMREQDERYGELSRANKLTSAWRKYGDKRFLGKGSR